MVGWTPSALGLADTLASVAPRGVEHGPAVVCMGALPTAQVERDLPGEAMWTRMRYLEIPPVADGIDALAEALNRAGVADARSIVLLPDAAAPEPDAASRVVCLAIARACADRPIPNVLVEVEDPEAAYEFAGLGVATVFYPGYLRAALLAHACVDLGVFQFVYGLLQGTYRVRFIGMPESLVGKPFVDALRELEEDDEGRPQTVIGVQERDQHILINPGPKHPLDEAVGLLVLEER